MGVLFGLPNQLALFVVALGLCTTIIWGYRMWWQRRPGRLRTGTAGNRRLFTMLRQVPIPALALIASAAAVIGWFLPVMGASLLAFLFLDFILGWRSPST